MHTEFAKACICASTLLMLLMGCSSDLLTTETATAVARRCIQDVTPDGKFFAPYDQLAKFMGHPLLLDYSKGSYPAGSAEGEISQLLKSGLVTESMVAHKYEYSLTQKFLDQKFGSMQLATIGRYTVVGVTNIHESSPSTFPGSAEATGTIVIHAELNDIGRAMGIPQPRDGAVFTTFLKKPGAEWSCFSGLELLKKIYSVPSP